MKKLIIFALLISISIFADPSVNIIKVEMNGISLESNAQKSFDFDSNYFNKNDYLEDKKEVKISFEVIEDQNTEDIKTVTGISLKSNKKTTTFNQKNASDRVITFKLTDVYDNEPNISDNNVFEIQIQLTTKDTTGNVSEITSPSKLTFHYDNKLPEAPSLDSIVVEPGDKHVKLKWDSVEDVNSYIVYYKTVDGNEKSKETNTTSIDITKLENKTEYLFKIKSIDKAGNESSEGDFNTTATPTQTEDFWETYRANGGEEEGGCSYTTNKSSYYFIIFMMFLLIIRKTILRGNNE